jgi:hypothetical protein
MTEQFTPMFPGSAIRERSVLTEDLDPEFALSVGPEAPDAQPVLHELIPHGSAVPVPFDASPHRHSGSFARTAKYTDTDSFCGTSASAVYLPGGDVGKLGAHLGCRVTTVAEARGSDGDAVDAYYTETLWEAFDGDPTASHYTGWVTSDLEETTAFDHRRSVYAMRAPLLRQERIPESVSRPVAAHAFVVQSLPWGLLETCVYLAPDPEEGRARSLAVSVADQVGRQAVRCPNPQQMDRHRESPEEDGAVTTRTDASESSLEYSTTEAGPESSEGIANPSVSAAEDALKILAHLQPDRTTSVPRSTVIDELQTMGYTRDQADQALKHLRRTGEIYEPASGEILCVGSDRSGTDEREE